ncbi:MAG: hypothetical protein EOP04_17150 [Proteobacteria bacterium]|nr:MAG: hypothetical protein EOP04_17150 [Pseudomonadota bacterium]
MVNKARGKSGPLFSFDVHDDVRLLHDATKERDEVSLHLGMTKRGLLILRFYSRMQEKSWSVHGTSDRNISSPHLDGKCMTRTRTTVLT